jgi:hypothetical protein
MWSLLVTGMLWLILMNSDLVVQICGDGGG